ncbi:MAG: hypothetical protein ABR588_03710 [Sphingomicrobium sp.]
MLGWLSFLWPTIVNGNVFFLSDTTSYMRGADAVSQYLIGRSSEWSTEPIEAVQNRALHPAVPVRPETDTRVVLAGRSIYYGALLYLTASLGGFVAMAMLQAALCVACAALTARRLSMAAGYPITPFSLAIVLVALGLLTAIGFFAAYMVPDVFAPLGALAVASLVAFRSALSRAERIFWWLVLVAALSFHSANLLIFGLLCISIGLAFVFSGPVRAFPAAALASAFLIGLASELLFSIGIQATTGSTPVRPPFVAARLIDDGAGRGFLRDRCGHSDLLLCQWRDRLPQGSDTILWSRRPGDASFALATPQEKRRLASEQSRFLWAVVRDRPLAVAGGSFKALVKQSGKWSLSEFNYPAADRDWLEQKVPERAMLMLKATAAWHDEMPVNLTEWSNRIAFAIALFASLGIILAPLRAIPSSVRWFLGILAGAIFCNAFVAGTLSTPHDRYLMRITWVLPLAVLALVRPLLFTCSVERALHLR